MVKFFSYETIIIICLSLLILIVAIHPIVNMEAFTLNGTHTANLLDTVAPIVYDSSSTSSSKVSKLKAMVPAIDDRTIQDYLNSTNIDPDLTITNIKSYLGSCPSGSGSSGSSE